MLREVYTAETLAKMRGLLPYGNKEEWLKKAVTISTGLTFYDLRPVAMNHYPVITPIRNRLPRTQRPNPGDAAHWKAVTALLGSGYNSAGWVPEGQRSAAMSYTTQNKSLTYTKIGEEDWVSVEAVAAAKGFEDEQAKVTMRLLDKAMLKEESCLLGGNQSIHLGTPTTPSTSAPTVSGATLNATYSLIVVALSYTGYKESSLAAGVATQKTITGMDGQTFVLHGGSSQKSAAASQAVTTGQGLAGTVPTIAGAVAYAWYAGTSGSEKLEAITTTNSVLLSALAGTGQAASAITADNSYEPDLAFDGLISIAASQGTLKVMPTGTAGTGTTLTASGRGTIVEIDALIKQMWDTWRIGPSVMYVSSQEMKTLLDKCLNNSSGPLLQIIQQAGGDAPSLVAGQTIGWYTNPFTPNGIQKIEVVNHPECPPGTIILHAEHLPAWYRSNDVPNVAEVLTRQDYYRRDWPMRTERFEYGVYTQEVLAPYAPFGFAILTNIAAN